MRITFDLPDPAASLLLRLASCISAAHTGPAPTPDAICQSMIVDLLVDDAVMHGTIPASDFSLN